MLVNELEYIKLKKVLLKYYKNNLVFIDVKGSIDARLPIHSAKILINKRKIIVANEEMDFTIDLAYVTKIKYDTRFRIIFTAKDYQILLEV